MQSTSSLDSKESLKLTQNLKGVRVAVIISDGFEQSEFEVPVNALRAAGATVEVLAQSPKHLTDGIQGVKHITPGKVVHADKLVVDADPETFDGLLIPGGAVSSDQLRSSIVHHGLVENFMDAQKPIAVICHGPWLLADAGVLHGVTMTSYPSIKKDLEYAGAVWKDREVIEDRNIISSRGPADLVPFTRAFAEQLARFKSARRKSAA